jgi:hypothetical protein
LERSHVQTVLLLHLEARRIKLIVHGVNGRSESC